MTAKANPQTSADLEEMNRAMDRIRDDMAKNPKDGAIQMIGGVLTELLRRHPTLAGNLSAEGKSLVKAMKAMEAEARKQKTGSWACVDGLTGMKIVLGYYDISTILERELADAILVACGAKPEAPVKEAPEDEFDLDSILGEV